MTPEERAAAVYINSTGPINVTRYACHSLQAEIADAIREAEAEMKERAIAAARAVEIKHRQEAQDARGCIGGDPEYDENLAEGAALAQDAIRALE